MHLQCDESGGIEPILKVRHADPIEPGLDAPTASLHANMVPLILSKSFLRFGLILQVKEPAAAPLVINPARPCTAGGVNLDLVTMHPFGRNLPGTAAPVVDMLGVKGVAPYLDAGVHPWIDLVVVLQNKIGIFSLGAKEAIAAGLQLRRADHTSILNRKRGAAPFLNPAIKRFAIKEARPLPFRMDSAG